MLVFSLLTGKYSTFTEPKSEVCRGRVFVALAYGLRIASSCRNKNALIADVSDRLKVIYNKLTLTKG